MHSVLLFCVVGRCHSPCHFHAQALRTVELMTRSTSHLAIFGGDTNLRENETPIHAGLVSLTA